MMRCTDCGKFTKDEQIQNGRCMTCDTTASTRGMGMMLIALGSGIGLLILGGLLYLSWKA
jgi:hypothetical protein